jgi:hypothetical protein
VGATGQVLNPGSGAIGGGGGSGCPGNVGKVKVGNLWKCPPAAPATPAAGGPYGGFFPTPPAAPALQRPNLTPINPQAEYDPEIAKQLARQRANTEDLKAGTGFAEDVAVGAERDVTEAQIREAEQGAAQAGIPFDRGQFLMEAQRGQALRRTESTRNREQQAAAALRDESGVAQGQAAERTDRLGIDLRRDMGENELVLDRYRTDAQVATAANNALMDFYGRMTSGMFGMMGQIGGGASGGNFSQSNQYGGY